MHLPYMPQDISPWRRPADLAMVAGLLALYFALARWGLEGAALRYAPVSLIWPSSGVALALVLRFGSRPWPLLFITTMAASWPNIMAAGGAAVSDAASALLIGASGTLEPVLAGWAIHRVAGGAFLRRASAFLISTLVVLPLSAVVATIPLVAGSLVGGLATVNHWAGLLTTWYGMAVADLMGMIVLAPPIWLWLRPPAVALTARQALELLAYAALAAFALTLREPVQPLYLLFAAHLAMAVRIPLQYTSVAITVTAIMLLWQGAADIAAADPPAYDVFLSELTFLLTLALMTYVTAVLWTEASDRREHLEQRVQEDTQELQEANDRLKHLTNTDSLTGAWNRRYFDEHTRRELDRAAHGGATVALLALDIDHFKRINDEHGHPTGDAVLEQVVARLDRQLRPGDMLARIGGEEFVVFLPNCGAMTAREVGERLGAAVSEEPIVIDHVSVAVTVSIGVAVTRPADDRRGRSLDDLLRATVATADRRLLEAKQAGRGRTVGP